MHWQEKSVQRKGLCRSRQRLVFSLLTRQNPGGPVLVIGSMQVALEDYGLFAAMPAGGFMMGTFFYGKNCQSKVQMSACRQS